MKISTNTYLKLGNLTPGLQEDSRNWVANLTVRISNDFIQITLLVKRARQVFDVFLHGFNF